MRVGQTKWVSLVEAGVSTAIGFVVAFTANLIILPLFGFHPTFSQNMWLTIFFTLISVVRGYFIRRLFNWWHERSFYRRLTHKVREDEMHR